MSLMSDDDKLIDDKGNVDEDELDRRIRAMGLDSSPVIDNAKKEAAKIDDEFEARLKELEERAKGSHQTRENKKLETNRRMASDRDSAKGLGLGLSIAYTIIGLPLLGVLIGWFMDQRVGGQTFTSIGVLVGSVLGIVGTVFMLSKANR